MAARDKILRRGAINPGGDFAGQAGGGGGRGRGAGAGRSGGSKGTTRTEGVTYVRDGGRLIKFSSPDKAQAYMATKGGRVVQKPTQEMKDNAYVVNARGRVVKPTDPRAPKQQADTKADTKPAPKKQVAKKPQADTKADIKPAPKKSSQTRITATDKSGKTKTYKSVDEYRKARGTDTKADTKPKPKKQQADTKEKIKKALRPKDASKMSGTEKVVRTALGQGTKGKRSGVAIRDKKGKLAGVSSQQQQQAANLRTGAKATGAGAVSGATLGSMAKENKRISDDMADERLRKDIEKDKNKGPLRTKVTRGEGKLTAAQQLKRLTQEAEKNKKSDDKPKRSAPKRTDNSEALADRLTARMMELQEKGMSNKEATEQLIKERKAGKFAKGGNVKKSNKGAQDFRGDYGCTMSTVDNRKKRKK